MLGGAHQRRGGRPAKMKKTGDTSEAQSCPTYSRSQQKKADEEKEKLLCRQVTTRRCNDSPGSSKELTFIDGGAPQRIQTRHVGEKEGINF